MAEKRLIDANLMRFKAFADPDSGEAIVFIQDIDEAPAVDAVEVVRCKDCRHWNEMNGKDSGKPVGYGHCGTIGINGIAYKDSFCSYGERRTDG